MYSLKLNHIALILFGIAVYTGMQGAKYFLSNRLQELGILISIGLFLAASFTAAVVVRDQDLKWSWWFFLTLVFVGYSVILPGFVFSSSFDAPALPSILASREFLGVFIGPALWFLYRCGTPVERIERVFLFILIALLLSYLFHYFRMDLAATLRSSDHTVAGLVSYDPWRGYRLRPPNTALFLATIISPALIIQARSNNERLIWVFTFLICLFVWSLFLSRAAAATILVSAILYHLFFSSKQRLALLFVALPIILPAATLGFQSFLNHLESLGPFDGVRYVSYNLAWSQFMEQPLLGYGQDSNVALTFQEVLWKYFFPMDIGIVGVAFKYGITGTLIYLFFSIYLIVRLATVNWLHKKAYGHSNLLLVGLLILFTSFILNIVLSPNLLRITGSSLASIAIALTAIWKHKIKTESNLS